jgi:hypothetical protein
MQKINLLIRLSAFFSIGPKYYHGPLYKYFEEMFVSLENNKISHEDAIKKVSFRFNSDKKIRRDLNRWIEDGEIYSHQRSNVPGIIGNKVRLFSRIRFGIMRVENNEYEPMHCHTSGFTSFQILIKGRVFLDTADLIKIDDYTISYRVDDRIILEENDLILNSKDYKSIHGFGAMGGDAYFLSVCKFSGFLGKYRWNQNKVTISNRQYLDIDNQKMSSDFTSTSLISESEAYSKYKAM